MRRVINPKKNMGITLDVEMVDLLREGSSIRARQRFANPKVSAFLNEFLNRYLPDYVEYLRSLDSEIHEPAINELGDTAQKAS